MRECIQKIQKGCALKILRGVSIQTFQEGCAFNIFKRGVHSIFQEGCALKVSIGLRIQNMSSVQTIMRGMHRRVCIYLSRHLPTHAPILDLNAHPSLYPWNSGPIQWARGDVGLKPSAAARPRATATVPRAGVRSTRRVQGSAAVLASTKINEPEEAQNNLFFVSFLGLFCACILTYVGFCLRLALSCSRPRV